MRKIIIAITIMTGVMLTYSKAPFISSDSYEAEYISWDVGIADEWITCEDDYYLWRYPWEDREIIKNVCVEFDIPLKYLYRLHYIESKMNPNAVRYETNGSVSIGYSQLNSSNKAYFANKFNNGHPINFYDKEQNIYIGAAYLKYLYTRLGNDWLGAFTAYNWGLGNYRAGKRIPNMTLDYAFTIYHGPKYVPFVKVLIGAVKGII